MSVLIIDDDRARIKQFRQHLHGFPTTDLSRAGDGIKWLEDHAPKLIFLDYDLHEHGTSRAESGCGKDVASWIVRHPKQFAHTLIVIHSLNSAGAEKMHAMFVKVGITSTKIPFAWQRPADLDRLLRGLC
jgi:CheY-like chemotaxis protein